MTGGTVRVGGEGMPASSPHRARKWGLAWDVSGPSARSIRHDSVWNRGVGGRGLTLGVVVGASGFVFGFRVRERARCLRSEPGRTEGVWLDQSESVELAHRSDVTFLLRASMPQFLARPTVVRTGGGGSPLLDLENDQHSA